MSRPQFSVDTLEKARTLLDSIYLARLEGIGAGLDYLLKEYPEIRACSHRHIAELLGVARETVSRHFWQTDAVKHG